MLSVTFFSKPSWERLADSHFCEASGRKRGGVVGVRREGDVLKTSLLEDLADLGSMQVTDPSYFQVHFSLWDLAHLSTENSRVIFHDIYKDSQVDSRTQSA